MAPLKRFTVISPDTIERGFIFGSLRLYPDGTLMRGDAIIHLPPKELAALRLLLNQAGQIVTHKQLKQALWGDVHVTEDSVPKCMSSLRERLEPEDCIQTVYKRGYRLSTEIRQHEIVPSERLPRLAIMPFASGFNVAAYLGPAIAEETISLLTGESLPSASVIARDSVFTLAAHGLTAQQVGETLHADLVLAGTLRALPAHFRLRVEMIRVADDTQIWVEDILVAQSRVAGLESELAQRLFLRLNNGFLSLSASAAHEPLSENEPARREAHDLFLRGHHEWKSVQRHRMQESVQHLLRAIELDPSLIVAHVELANASIAQALYGFMAPDAAVQMVRAAAEGIELTAEGSEAILPALGWVRFHFDHDLTGALMDFAASAHLPHEASVTRLRSMFALSRHRFSEAAALLGDALRTDPYAPWLSARLAWTFHLAGESAKSVEYAEHALEVFPDHEGANLYGAIILAFNGQTERAISIAENLTRKSPYFDLAVAVHGYALARAGRHQEARAIVERLQWLSRERFVISSFTPAICVALGDLDSAIETLQVAANVRCPWFFQMLADPRLESLHKRPEFVSMQQSLARMESEAEKHLAS